MKRKLKLAFDQLEKELALIPQMELSQILGGNSSGSSGSSSGLPPYATVDDVVDYLQDSGVPLTQDSSGNYYYHGSSGGIMLDEVEIVGYANNTNSSGFSSGHTSSGYSSSGSSGYASGNALLNAYMNYLANYGVTFTANSTGGYSYVPPPSQPAGPDDEWKRGGPDNEIIKTPTGRTTLGSPPSVDGLLSRTLPSSPGDGIGQETLFFQEVLITTEDNSAVTAYEVVMVKDANGNTIPIDNRHKSNCTGLAFANGEVWIFDSDLATDETSSFMDMVSDTTKYQPVNKEDADYVIIRDATAGGSDWSIVHSGIVASDGSYTHKDSNGTVREGDSESQFTDKKIQPPGSSIVTSITYYKKL